ncbi:hypothetical protein BCR32DRAFT_298636 [Anaeromyces robustus]|uniref:Uncharacterized protein n=1 Tax=Anaeromyces robustus TaxID=1754192 RepID=A0A1Y1V528_9FUNG|nr:hypothetical protein BCR32DRAFT_298636 [Anaeromyces robustus]|eukprot:ORX47530.1 hypothetical protein BCR32DRAFT_298636 [Anaeromyces robustus]
MNLSVLFDTIIINANEAKALFSQGIETDAFNKLDEIVKTINILNDFKDKYSLWQYPAASTTNNIDILDQLSPDRKKRKKSPIEKYIRPVGSNTLNLNQPQAQPQQAQQITVLPDTYPISYSPNHVENELVDRLDEIFFGFLARVCSDLDASDNAGERIHQTMIAKKLNKVTETLDFKQFKFRIRSFTNAFREELQRSGITEDIVSEKKARHYLWQHKYISRFNEDGKKAKSKGNHVWIIEAKKTSDGGWIFKEFERKIAGPEPSPIAYVGVRYTYQPKIYDPQIRSPKAVFHSPWLPSWLSWENNVLTGIPDETAQKCEIKVIASYYHGDSAYQLEKSFILDISRWQGQNETPIDGSLSTTLDTTLNTPIQYSDSSSIETDSTALVTQYTPTTFNTPTTFTPTTFTPTTLTPTTLTVSSNNISTLAVTTDSLAALAVTTGFFSPQLQVATGSPEVPSSNEFYQTTQPINTGLIWPAAF